MVTDISPKKKNHFAAIMLLIFLIAISFGESKQYEAGKSYAFIGPTAPEGENYSYLWIASDGYPITSHDMSFQWTAPEVTEPTSVLISLLIDNGCINKNETKLLVVPSEQPVCAFIADTPVCEKSTGNHASVINPSTDATYVWSIIGSPGSSIAADPADGSKALWSAGTGTQAIIAVNATLNDVTSNCSRSVSIQSAPAAQAGPNQTICSGSRVQLAGSATNALSTTWRASSQGGSFDDAGKLDAIYTPGADDIESGTFTLTLIAIGDSVCEQTATSEVVISIQKCSEPHVLIENEMICLGETATLKAIVSGCTVILYQWYVGDSPSGEMIPYTNSSTYQTTKEGIYSCEVTCADEKKSFGSASVSFKQCEFPNGSLSGVKFNDSDGDGSKEGNGLLGGWMINLMQGDTVVNSTTTSTEAATLGSYKFTGILPGTYTLEEVPSFSSDWTQTYPKDNIYSVFVSENGQIRVTMSDQTEVGSNSLDFGNKYNPSGGRRSPLEVTKTTPDEVIRPDTDGTFIITVKNNGTVEIHGISIVDELSPMLEFVPYAYSGNTQIQHIFEGGNIVFDLGPLGTLQPGDSWTIIYRVKLSPNACTSDFTPTSSIPMIAADETKLKVMAVEDGRSNPSVIVQLIDALSRNKTKLEAKLKSIKRNRGAFDKANSTQVSGIRSIAGINLTSNNYINVSSGYQFYELLNANGSLAFSEYIRPDKYDSLFTEYETNGEVKSDFYSFLPTKETLKIEYNKPQMGYKTYTVRYYATGDTLIMIYDFYGNLISVEYRKTPGLAAPEYLTNCATAYGKIGEIDELVVSNRACANLGWSCQTGDPVIGMLLSKKADREVAQVGETVRYAFTVQNTGTIALNYFTLNDDKMGIIVLNDPDPLGPGESRTYYGNYTIKVGDGPKLVNVVIATALDPDENIVTRKATEYVNIIEGCGLTKTASPKVVRPGDYVTYNITWNIAGSADSNYFIIDDYPQGVSFISATPSPVDDGKNNKWKITTANGTITIIVQVAQDIGNTSFEMDQGVRGTGFVNVRNDIRTNPVILKNKATLYKVIDGSYFEDCTAYADVNIGPPQTYVSLKEHGSGDYASEEVIRYQNSNRSITVTKGLTATHKPTSFSLPNNRDVDFQSKWSEMAKSKNYATGGSTNEQYTHASRIIRNSSLNLNENGSTMKTETDFEGVGHIGLVKKAIEENKTWNASEIFQSQEDYVGSFKINQKFDEYGKNAEYEKSVNGTGYVSASRNVGKAQSSYESGTGSYQSEEKISTVSNYISKDINLSHLPTSYIYTPTFSMSSDLMWSEGMWSKTPNSLISERFSSASNLSLQSTARGLNEMATEASVTGQADFRTAYRDEKGNDTIDQQDRYVGKFDIKRKTLLGGVAKYDRPHISLSKMAKVDLLNSTIADYRIIIENNGNQALEPVYVKDVFPAGTEYITSSLRPAELTASYANWSLPAMGIGSKVIIDLRLNITEEPSNLVNRVEAAGKYDKMWTLARNFSVSSLNWLTCCPPEISASKTARIDALDPQVVWYTLNLKNREKYTMVVFWMDRLPLSMRLLNSSQEPSENRSDLITWTILDLAPGENRSIVYRARAESDGTYINTAHIEAFSVDGPDGAAADVKARVDLGAGGALVSSSSSDWQPPTCFGLNCSGRINDEDWMPCYTCGTGETGSGTTMPPCASCIDTGDDSLP